MSPNYFIYSASKSANLDSKSIPRLYEQNLLLKFLKVKANNSKITQKHEAKK